jgi:hypothetical protein
MMDHIFKSDRTLSQNLNWHTNNPLSKYHGKYSSKFYINNKLYICFFNEENLSFSIFHKRNKFIDFVDNIQGNIMLDIKFKNISL